MDSISEIGKLRLREGWWSSLERCGGASEGVRMWSFPLLGSARLERKIMALFSESGRRVQESQREQTVSREGSLERRLPVGWLGGQAGEKGKRLAGLSPWPSCLCSQPGPPCTGARAPRE